MNKLIIAVAGLGALAAFPALAAEMPLKAPVAPAPVVTWTGGYFGLGLGGEWASTRWTTTCFAYADAVPVPPAAGSCANPDPLFDVIDRSSPHTFSSAGFRPSFYGGWNLQTGSTVVGLEFDLGYENQKSTLAGIPGCITYSCNGRAGESTWVQMDVDGSFRLRGGFLAAPDVLVYATGGAAFQSFRANVNCAADSIFNPIVVGQTGFTCQTTQGSRQTATPFGWTGGGGLEYKSGQFIFRGEYRYSDFGNTDVAFFQPDSVSGQGIHARLHVTTQIAYFGISYLWGPVTARPAGGGAEY